MKNLRLLFLLIVFTFSFSSVPNTAQAISSNASVTGVTQEKSKIGERISSVFKKVKSQVRKVLTKDTKTKVIFWLVVSLLIFAGIILGVALIFFGILLFFSFAPFGVFVILLGVFLPIVGLFFAFRSVLRNYFRKIGKDVTKKMINLYSFLLSLLPGLIATLYFIIGY